MKNPVIYILFFFLLLGNYACSQSENRVVINITDDSNKVLEYKTNLNSSFSKKFSDNKNCRHEIYKEDLYLSSTLYEYKDGKTKSEIFLRKTDLEGNEKWVFKIDQFIQAVFKDILPTDEGVYILYEGYTGDIERDCYLKKIDNQGKELWTKNFGKKYGTQGLDTIKLYAAGNILFPLCHYETSTLYRVSPSGKVLNKKSFLEKSEFIISDFDFDKEGNLFLIGQITSYPQRKTMMEIFFYKLDDQFNVLQKKVISFGRSSIANDIAYLESGNFAVKLSTDLDFNRKDIEKQMTPLFFLLDTDFNITNISQISSTKSNTRSTFKLISDNKIIAHDVTYLNKKSYHLFHVFDGEMNYQKSTLINFKGATDFSILPDNTLLVNKFQEEIYTIKIDLN